MSTPKERCFEIEVTLLILGKVMHKIFVSFLFLVCLSFGAFWINKPIATSIHSKPITTLIGDSGRSPMFAYVDENPLVALAEKIALNASEKKLRVGWYGSLGSGWDRGTLLYNRQHKTLTLYDENGAGEAGEEFHLKHYRFTHVSDEIILSLVEQYNKQDKIEELLPFGFLHILPKYGATKHKIADFAIYKTYNNDLTKRSTVKKFY